MSTVIVVNLYLFASSSISPILNQKFKVEVICNNNDVTKAEVKNITLGQIIKSGIHDNSNSSEDIPKTDGQYAMRPGLLLC